MDKRYFFIIDTNSYAGNFERNMCAYLTGQIGDCEVGDDIAAEFEEQFPDEYAEFQDIIGSDSDEHGCSRPCEMCHTEGRFGFVSASKTYDEGEDIDMEDVRKQIVANIESYYKTWIQQAEAAIDNGHAEWANDLRGYREAIAKSHTDPIVKTPVYESVRIIFNKKPTEKQIKFMQDRAMKFIRDTAMLKEHRTSFDIEIRGFRLGEETVTVNYETVPL